MTIPTKLITTTIEEFAAEGYECKSAKVDGEGIVADGNNVQVVSLEFHKKETTDEK